MAEQERNYRKTDPKFARESFTWRRMKPWQIVALVAILAVATILALWWV